MAHPFLWDWQMCTVERCGSSANDILTTNHPLVNSGLRRNSKTTCVKSRIKSSDVNYLLCYTRYTVEQYVTHVNNYPLGKETISERHRQRNELKTYKI